jgi:hypothetical protein
MRFVADTHLHLYPCHDPDQTLNRLLLSLVNHDPVAVHLAFLAERSDCDFFTEIREGRVPLSLDVREVREQPELLVLGSGDRSLCLFSGRQIISQERIEVLALMTANHIPDGLPARELIARVLADGAIPVISWAPGKWFFKRKGVVQGLLESFAPGQLLLGDTSLRPTLWPTPILMQRARKKGFGIVAGSDPLPFAGEEQLAGRYLTAFNGPFDPERPADSVRTLLQAKGTEFQILGTRCGAMESFRRLAGNARAKKESMQKNP